MSLLKTLQTIGRAPFEEREELVRQLIDEGEPLGALVLAARDHRGDPLVSNTFTAIKTVILNPQHPLERLGSQAEC